MKKPNLILFAAGAFIAVSLTLAACGNKGGDNPAPVPVVVNPNCIGCTGGIVGGSTLFTSTSSDYYGTTNVTFNFMAQGSLTPNYPTSYYPGYNGSAGYPSVVSPTTYSGTVSATGQLTIGQTMYSGYCSIPAGTYSLIAVQPGQWGYGIVTNLGLQAIGPTTLTISFMGQVSASTGYTAYGTSNTSGRMFGNLYVQSMNGQACYQNLMIQ